MCGGKRVLLWRVRWVGTGMCDSSLNGGESAIYVTLIFLSLPTPEIAMARVAARVVQGGHPVPEDVIRRRFVTGWRNFQERYKFLVDTWVHYDNSGARPALVEQGRNL